MSDKDLEDKFLEQTSGILTTQRGREILDQVWKLEEARDSANYLNY